MQPEMCCPRDKHFNPSLEQGDDPETICRKIFASEVNVLNRTLAGIDLPLLTKVADQITQCKAADFLRQRRQPSGGKGCSA